MPADRLFRSHRGGQGLVHSAACSLAASLSALCAAACTPLQPVPQAAPPPAPAAAAPEPAPPPPPTPVSSPVAKPQPDAVNAADRAARRLLACHERLRQMSPTDVAAEVNRLSGVVSSADAPATPDDVLALALALVQEHNAGDLARASSLLEPLAQDSSAVPQPWQPLARLLLARISEQRRLEEQLDKMTAQRRDTQRAIQQLTEKLEALKAIERSMTAHPAAASPAAPGSAPGAESAPPPAPKP
jgi:hypothetical protein